MKQLIHNVEKDSKIKELFKENKRSVCWTTHKEIVDESFHIVILPCRHPLCCEYAADILMND